ncbi:DUF2200 domain-containing protein [Vagococcus zengguangii]|uniref:DUF2200 domain-containing protein n=1 Tax=Vagococcus zengguangii TaxID=2571750 RepID=A0A4D7CQN3_9ENTE|nr:DUF2200 domain-containing protein [Vagococcus zengguangii]QCI86408.1 DUF2200 domain-containing protein [Vagococcus zengguangii]TLG81342.1 DUF2200 family protein [Vagococcus zengguangii]
MKKPRIYTINFATVYPLYVQKVEKKGRTEAELLQIIEWLTGYDQSALIQQMERQVDMETLIDEAPSFNANSALITGVICGKRVEEIEDSMTQNIRYLDKVVDELAKGKKLEKIMREA